MPKFSDPQLEVLWQSWLEAREAYLEAEELLLGYEQKSCPAVRDRAHDFIARGEKIRRQRDEARERYEAAERRFVAFRDAHLLGIATA